MSTEPDPSTPTPTPIPNPEILNGITDHVAKTYTLSSQEQLLEDFYCSLVSRLTAKPEELFRLPNYLPANAGIPLGIREVHSKLMTKSPNKIGKILRLAGKFLLASEIHKAEAITKLLLKQDPPAPFSEPLPISSKSILTYLLICIPIEYRKAILNSRFAVLTTRDRYTLVQENEKLMEKRKQDQQAATLQTPSGETIVLSAADLEKMGKAQLLPPPGYLQPEDTGYLPPSIILDPAGKPASLPPSIT